MLMALRIELTRSKPLPQNP